MAKDTEDISNHSCPLLHADSRKVLVLEIATEAKTMIKNEALQEVGRNVVNKFFYVVGAVTIAAIVWLNSKHF